MSYAVYFLITLKYAGGGGHIRKVVIVLINKYIYISSKKC